MCLFAPPAEPVRFDVLDADAEQLLEIAGPLGAAALVAASADD